MSSTKLALNSIVILFFVSTAVSDTVPHPISNSWKKAINHVKMACLAEGDGTTPHDVAEMVKTWNIPESMKCFMDCVYKKNHFVDKNGHFTDELLDYKGMTRENIQGCEDAVQTSNKDSCDRVYDFCKCIVKDIKDKH
ncbi:uncharacterized protein LOC116166604 [Photinus pyralis]|uniref:uncharacterized protein LOC116166604 n=1 Tax=Photinus pyralis TaxID=7054 RepID=UPI001266EBC3|nr:uncharacterized protein LOC116166604 [Photinus pyralis]